jgi:thioredoxin-like negative regulator of GroEL
VIFATPEGEEIARFSGYRKPDQVYEIVKTVSSVGPKVAELYAELGEDERSFELHRELGTIYAELGVAGKACHHLERARRSAPNQQAAAEVAFLRARARLAAGDCDIAEDILKDLIEEAGDGEAPAAWREALDQARTDCAEAG